MLEFLVVYLLAKHNGDMVEEKGQSGTAYRWYTAGLWFGGEILGAMIGAAAAGPRPELLDIYPYALLGAAGGAAIAWYLAKQVPVHLARLWTPNALTPPTGMPAWAQPNPALPPVATVPGNTELLVESRAGDWALVRDINGWRGYVDARMLLDRPVSTVWQSQPQPPSQPPPQ
jgi:hypothetical protein